MKHINNSWVLSASDLVNHAACHHLSHLDQRVALGELAKPARWNPVLERLQQRGLDHEAATLEHLSSKAPAVVTIEGVDITEDAVAQTLEAMQNGVDLIAQGALRGGHWVGRADLLLRQENTPSNFGDWSYQVADTKLAKETRGAALLQLCLYSHLLEQVQGTTPEHLHVIPPNTGFVPDSYRYGSLSAYFRRMLADAEAALLQNIEEPEYPDPKPHCDICRWAERCDRRRHDDDHLCLVAGAGTAQVIELQAQGINTLAALAETPLPLTWQPSKGSADTYGRLALQAQIQLEGRNAGAPRWAMLDRSEHFGLHQLPAPSPGDIFFDIESDQFVGDQGIEYLLGWGYADSEGTWHYQQVWALNAAEEKSAFEQFIALVMERRTQWPAMHVYHFAPYEPGAMKRLMGRFGTCADELDTLLRGKVFVDLLQVMRRSVRASVESYSLKALEPFFGYARKVPLQEANAALGRLCTQLEFNDGQAVDAETRTTVSGYNEDDCKATWALQQWLEERRDELVASGEDIPRPETPDDQAPEELTERQERINALVTQLTADVPVEPEERTAEQHARWLLAHMLDWHRREEKTLWWEYFRLMDLGDDELLQEKGAVARLEALEIVDQSKTGIPTRRFQYPAQDAELRPNDGVMHAGGDNYGTVVAVYPDTRELDVRATGKTKDDIPTALFRFNHVGQKPMQDSLLRIAEHTVAAGLCGNPPYAAAHSLLLCSPPEVGGAALRLNNESALDAARRIAPLLNGTVLPIQGPPGTGKSYTGARMICELVRAGKRVGITATSHKVIRNLMDKVLEAATEQHLDVQCIKKVSKDSDEVEAAGLQLCTTNDDMLGALASGTAQVAGATTWFWAREDATACVDVLVVDEAGQMSLANTLAVAPAANSLVLLGDQQQLEQPSQGVHPDGTGVSALDHLLDGEQTIPDNRGLFLETTWRLHPAIAKFVSGLYYQGRLDAKEGCDQQRIEGPVLNGSGLRFLPVEHNGNTSASPEEADAVADLVQRLTSGDTTWRNRDGNERPLVLDDILVIAPYNLQVLELQRRLPNARIGTVDKFQGQEAPITIYSMTTSSQADAPRGMEFLYSGNRLNVAVSRAMCMTVLVASSALFEVECRTPRQMVLANGLFSYLEAANVIV